MRDLEQQVAAALRERQKRPRYTHHGEWWIVRFPLDEADYIPLEGASVVIAAALRAAGWCETCDGSGIGSPYEPLPKMRRCVECDGNGVDPKRISVALAALKRDADHES
jgi:hypothetical protein